MPVTTTSSSSAFFLRERWHELPPYRESKKWPAPRKYVWMRDRSLQYPPTLPIRQFCCSPTAAANLNKAGCKRLQITVACPRACRQALPWQVDAESAWAAVGAW